jgi:hypothetical protein
MGRAGPDRATFERWSNQSLNQTVADLGSAGLDPVERLNPVSSNEVQTSANGRDAPPGRAVERLAATIERLANQPQEGRARLAVGLGRAVETLAVGRAVGLGAGLGRGAGGRDQIEGLAATIERLAIEQPGWPRSRGLAQRWPQLNQVERLDQISRATGLASVERLHRVETLAVGRGAKREAGGRFERLRGSTTGGGAQRWPRSGLGRGVGDRMGSYAFRKKAAPPDSRHTDLSG